MNFLVMNFMICFIIPVIIFFLSYVIFFRLLNNRKKMTSFECGFDSFMHSRIPFSTRFFLLAILFIVFDVEIILLLPIPLLNMLNMKNLIMIMLIFIFLMVGLLHEWKEGSIEWMN